MMTVMLTAPSKDEVVDLFWRSAWTFIQAFGGVLTADVVLDYGEVALWKLAVGTGLASVFAAIKSFAGQQLGADATVITNNVV